MALCDHLDGYRSTAPLKAVRLLERFRFVNTHPAYTYEAYDRAKAGDLALDREFSAILQPQGKPA